MDFKKLNGTFVLLLLLIAPNLLNAKTWKTASWGYWGSNTTWVGGIVPSFTLSDTFIISYPVIFENSMIINRRAYIEIDSAGGLCGHHNILMTDTALVVQHGILELDSIFVTGHSRLWCYGPDSVILTNEAQVTSHAPDTAALYVNGATFVVGPWFNCKLPEYEAFAPFSAIKNFSHINQASYPNPTSGIFSISLNDNSMPYKYINIYNTLGQTILIQKIEPNNTIQQIDISTKPSGIYFWNTISRNGTEIENGKIVVAR